MFEPLWNGSSAGVAVSTRAGQADPCSYFLRHEKPRRRTGSLSRFRLFSPRLQLLCLPNGLIERCAACSKRLKRSCSSAYLTDGLGRPYPVEDTDTACATHHR
ncbi:hypothetical protein B0H12DRAFT_1125874 [Mycena haematopus]|nr:hypothetical protein B0H12DRAFT_1125874 [Mycena haematopus]